MRIPLEFYEVLRSRINLSDVVRRKVSLTKKVGNYLGLCPFHVEKTPSFTVNDAKRFYYCFGCSVHGDVIKFVSNLNGLSYKEAAIQLANDYGIELPKVTMAQQRLYDESEELTEILEIAERFFQSQLSKEVVSYLHKRGINDELIDTFSIGYAPSGRTIQKFFEEKSIPLIKMRKAGLVGSREDGTMYEMFYNRIMFPIKNVYNKVVGFGGRIVDKGLPKYLNSPETIIFRKHETLYGENNAISSAYKKNYSILVEGYLDVIALYKAGFKEAMASLGTSVTEQHLQKLWRAGDEIVMCLDGDEAGMQATQRVINMALPLISSSKKISFVQLPRSLDPDDFINKEGGAEFKKLFDKRMNLSEMIWHTMYEGKTFQSPEEKALLEQQLEEYSKQIKDRTLSSNYYRFFKDQIWKNLIKRYNKGQTTSANITFSNTEYSEMEILEQVFCRMLIKFPELFKDQEKKDFLLVFNFQSESLGVFRDWYFEEILAHEICDAETIIGLVEKTRFYDTFLVLSGADNLFLDLSFGQNGSNPELLWQWLRKKYHLIMLKQEYISIVQNGSDEELRKIVLYREEIMKVSQELYNLNESFTN